MSDIDWVNLAQYAFFDNRNSPSTTVCDGIAQEITGATQISPVDTLSSMTYCVICTNCSSFPLDRIVLFRENNPKAKPLDHIVKLAKDTFGPLAPEPTYYGDVENAKPPVSIYTMPCQPGVSLLSAIPCQIDLPPNQKIEMLNLIRSFSKYFARSYSNPHPMKPRELLTIRQAGIRYQLRQFKEQASSVLPTKKIDQLIELVPTLFSDEYPSVITNGNLSLTNIRIDEATYEITNIVDWSLAKVLPFGMDLDILDLVTGFMGLRRWRTYWCKQELLNLFWDEFFRQVDPACVLDAGKVRFHAEQAALIGALLRYGFGKRVDGSSDGVVSVSRRDVARLRTWFGIDGKSLDA